jgi:hypothetical protein
MGRLLLADLSARGVENEPGALELSALRLGFDLRRCPTAGVSRARARDAPDFRARWRREAHRLHARVSRPVGLSEYNLLHTTKCPLSDGAAPLHLMG